MSNTANELKNWNLTATWELNHEKGLAQFTIKNGDEVVQSIRYTQGLFFDKNNKIANEEAGRALIWLMKELTRYNDNKNDKQ